MQNPSVFRLQTRLNIDDVTYDIKICSDNVEEQGRIMGRQAITLKKNAAGVNMIRMETVMENPEILLTGEGSMENASEEELRNFAQEFMRMVKDALMMNAEMGGVLCLGCQGRKWLDLFSLLELKMGMKN